MLGLSQLLDWFDRLRQRRTEVHVRVHRAFFMDAERTQCYFINLLNASPEREVTVTHVWLDTVPQVHALAKQLPARIAPRAQWETFVPVEQVPTGLTDDEVWTLARAMLADGTVVYSVKRENVPDVGYVP